MKLSRSLIAKAGAAVLVLAAAGTASVAQARDNVYFSIGANVAPGVVVGASNAPYYYGPRYYAPAPVYYTPAPVYYEPAPEVVYYGPEYYDPAVRIRYVWSPAYHRYYYMHQGRRHWR
jgi:hypothetical protein